MPTKEGGENTDNPYYFICQHCGKSFQTNAEKSIHEKICKSKLDKKKSAEIEEENVGEVISLLSHAIGKKEPKETPAPILFSRSTIKAIRLLYKSNLSSPISGK